MNDCVLHSSLFDLVSGSNQPVQILQNGGVLQGVWYKEKKILYWRTEVSSLSLELHEISVYDNQSHLVALIPVPPKALVGASGQVSYGELIPRKFYKQAGRDGLLRFRLRQRVARVVQQPTMSPMSMIDQYTTNDVVFVFPRAHRPPRLLWSNATTLAETSAYFKDLFFGDFEEGRVHPPPSLPQTLLASNEIAMLPGDKTPPPSDESAAKQADPSDEFQDEGAPREKIEEIPSDLSSGDSDAESDSAELGPPPNPRPIRRVFIRETPFKTYRALLYYLVTDKVSFAPTRSSSAAAQIADAEDRELPDAASSGAVDHSTPLPVSPKSLYRLAHSLSLLPLQQLCLQNIESQLSTSNVLEELFSSFAACYEEVKEVAIKVALRNWAEVVRSSGMQDFERALGDGEFDSHSARTAVELFKRLRPN